MGAEANGEETVDETQEVQEGQEEVPLNETALRGRHRHRPGGMDRDRPPRRRLRQGEQVTPGFAAIAAEK